MLKLFLLFTAVPFAELYLLLRVSDHIGFLATLAIVVATGMLGAAMARAEGLRVIRQWQHALAEGRLPEEGVIGGVLVLVGGVLLVTPGIMTDVAGFLLLLPVTRAFIARVVMARLERAIATGRVEVVSMDAGLGAFGTPGHRPRRKSRDPQIIDTEGEVVERDSR